MAKRSTWLFAAVLTLLLACPALAQQVDISGPWFLDFPQGQGTVILQKSNEQPPKYFGLVTMPYAGNPKGLIFHVDLHSAPSYVAPGNNITFMPRNAGAVQFFMMNVSSSSSGVAWIIPGPGADNNLLKYYGVKAPAHR